MVKISELLENCVRMLEDVSDDARFEVGVLAQSVFCKDRLWFKIHSDDEADEELCNKLMGYTKRRMTGEPSAYITGKKEFMSLDFTVNQDVLIPRPDTEILVEKVISDYSGQSVSILDLCTGSGAIACSLACYLEKSRVTGVDISEKAVEIARHNAESLSVADRVDIIKSDVLNCSIYDRMYDVVVSNPPYIETDVIKTLDTGVKDYEPSLALDGGADGLVFYRKIVSDVRNFLVKNGMLYFEIGYNQAEDVRSIMEKDFKNICVLKDYAGNDRVVLGQLV